MSLSSKEEHIPNYKLQGKKFRVAVDVWLCGPPGKDFLGNKFPGAYPAGFLNNLKLAFEEYWPSIFEKIDVLHVCSGRVPEDEGMRLDIDPKYHPDYLCNAETMILPSGKKIPDEMFKWTISDWPYNKAAAKLYYKKKLLSKHQAFHQMNRVTKVGGFIGILDEAMLAGTPKNLVVVALIGVRSVPNLDFRTFTVYKKIAPLVGKFKHSESNQKMENWLDGPI